MLPAEDCKRTGPASHRLRPCSATQTHWVSMTPKTISRGAAYPPRLAPAVLASPGHLDRSPTFCSLFSGWTRTPINSRARTACPWTRHEGRNSPPNSRSPSAHPMIQMWLSCF